MARSLGWYQAKGSPYNNYTSLDAVHYDYILAKTGLSGHSLDVDELESYLLATTITSFPQAIGNGSLQDRWKAFYAAKTGLAITLDYDYLEQQFFANNSLDFS